MTASQLAALAKRKKKWIARPSTFISDIFGVQPRPAQAEALDALSPKNARSRVTVHGYRGCGKTALLAWFAIYFVMLHKDAIVILLSASWMQLREILFPEITYWIDVAGRRNISLGASPKRTSWEPFGGRRAVGVSPRDPGKIQGFHARPNGAIATICDEPASVEDAIYAATRGYDANARICQRLSGGIPGANEGWFYAQTEAPGTHDVGVNAEECAYSDKQLLAECLRDWGRENPMFIAEQLGRFYSASKLGLCRPEWLAIARNGGTDVSNEGPVEVGADFGEGGDLSAYFARKGGVALDAETNSIADSMRATGQLKAFADRVHAKKIRGDAIGIGSGPCSRHAEQGYQVERYNGGKSARNSSEFKNRRAEDMWGWRKRLEEGRADLRAVPDDYYRKLAGQAVAIKMERNSSGQMQAERKADYKKRTGRTSPDELDAGTYAYAVPHMPAAPKGLAKAYGKR